MIYQFTLTDYTINPLGITTIVEEPNGWDGMELSLKRDEETHGVFFDCSIDTLEFYGGGASIIKAAYDLKKVEAKVDILIEVKCGENDTFETLYSGRLVFTNYKYFQKDDCYVQIGIEQKGALIEFRNKYETKVNLDLSTKTKMPFVASLPSKGIFRTSDMVQPTNINSELFCTRDGLIGGSASGGTVTRVFIRDITLDFDTLNKDEVDSYGLPSISSNYSSPPALFIVEEDGTYNINLDVQGTAFAWASVGCKVVGYSGANTDEGQPSLFDNFFYGYNDLLVELILETASTSIVLDSQTASTVQMMKPFSGTDCFDPEVNKGGFYIVPSLTVGSANMPQLNFSGTYSGSVALVKGDEIKLVVRITQTGEYYRRVVKEECYFMQGIVMNANSFFNINFISYYPATNCDLYAINETFAEITESITNNEMTIYSDYFGRTDAEPYTSIEDGCGSLMAITKGEKIRRIEIQNNEPTLELSFKDVFESINAIHNIGIAIEDDTKGSNDKLIRIEPVEYFYDNATILLTCDNVAEIEYMVDLKRMYQNISIGYDKYEAEEATGIDEFLTKHEYTLDSTQISTKKDIICKFIAGGYTWEITRRVGNDTTSDWRYDKETFVICLKRNSGNLVIEQGNISSDSNVVDPPTIYNYAITPTRNVMRWFKTISASMVDYTIDALKYTSGLSNVFATGLNTNSCALENAAIAENQNITYSNFIDTTAATPLWNPITATFKYPLSYTDFKALQAQPNGVIKFSHNDSVWSYGYILEIGYIPTDGMATFKLLIANI